MSELDVAIVGGGFTGCAIAANLARRANQAFSLAIFEPGSLGRGAAYGSAHREHLLNTRAAQMSINSAVSDDFVRWLGSRGGPHDFVSRRLYGDYVGDTVRKALERPRFAHVTERVAALRRQKERYILHTSSGKRFMARTVVLATGNPLPYDGFLPREVHGRGGYVADPWRFDYSAVSGEVLVVGSGLTALDVLVALKACGHRGRVHVLSRHGRFPQVHADAASYDVVPALDSSSAQALLRSFRYHLQEAERRGFDWRAVIDVIRPESEAIWRRVPVREQRRFERHLRTRWERHRHRAPREVDAVRDEYARSGRLRVYAGQLLRSVGDRITIGTRDGHVHDLQPAWIVNCSGVGRIGSLAQDPLIGTMLAGGAISPDARGMGLRVTPKLEAINAAGNAVANLWIVGPTVRGSRFEATAVPELRVMAESVASQIAAAARTEQPVLEVNGRR
ncbi:MAG: FAD/NAD(P)-binding protein [Candidatus Eremiobacteraeota bacterium]|nr:FAD/NAD(P)-binding protein [Candidatus Eremiobacteraeota bacterium]